MIEITIHRITEGFEVTDVTNFIDKVHGETLVEALAKMLLIVVNIQQKIDEEQQIRRNRLVGDDIPF